MEQWSQIKTLKHHSFALPNWVTKPKKHEHFYINSSLSVTQSCSSPPAEVSEVYCKLPYTVEPRYYGHLRANEVTVLTPSLSECLIEFCKLTLTFDSADQILWCDHSNESFLPVLTHGAICFTKFHEMKFGGNLLLAKFGSERVNEGLYTRKCMGVFAGRPKKKCS